MTWVKYILITYFVLILALISREFSVKSCISSNVVESLDIHGVFKIYNCSSHLDPEGVFTSEVSKSLAQAKKEISSFEDFLYRNKLPYPKPKTFHLEYRSSSQFTNQLSETWIRDLNPIMPPLFRAVYGDIFNKIRNGTSEMDRYRTDSLFLISDRQACEKGLVVDEKFSYCEVIQKSKTRNFEGLSYWSLRPMLYSAFLRILQTQNLTEKQAWVQHLAQQMLSTVQYPKEFEVQLDSLQEQFQAATTLLFQDVIPLRPLAYVVNFQVFSGVTPLEVFREILDLHGDGLYFYQGIYQSRWGQFRSQYASNLESQREIWIVEKIPSLRDLMVTQKQRLEFYKIGSSALYRVHIPSLALLFQLKKLKPHQNLDGLDSKMAQTWLGFNPVETVRN